MSPLRQLRSTQQWGECTKEVNRINQTEENECKNIVNSGGVSADTSSERQGKKEKERKTQPAQ